MYHFLILKYNVYIFIYNLAIAILTLSRENGR